MHHIIYEVSIIGYSYRVLFFVAITDRFVLLHEIRLLNCMVSSFTASNWSIFSKKKLKIFIYSIKTLLFLGGSLFFFYIVIFRLQLLTFLLCSNGKKYTLLTVSGKKSYELTQMIDFGWPYIKKGEIVGKTYVLIF